MLPHRSTQSPLAPNKRSPNSRRSQATHIVHIGERVEATSRFAPRSRTTTAPTPINSQFPHEPLPFPNLHAPFRFFNPFLFFSCNVIIPKSASFAFHNKSAASRARPALPGAMNALQEKCRPKHQVLVLKCYPRTRKGAVDVKPNSSELSYLLFYATSRRSKIHKIGAFLEKKTASDVWRVRIG